MNEDMDDPVVEGEFGEFDGGADPVEDDDWEPPAKRSFVPLIGVLLGGLLVGAGVGFGTGLGAMAAADALKVEEPEPEEVLVTQDLDVLNVNLRSDVGNRVLSIRAQLDVRTYDADHVEAQVPVLRDSLLLLASDHTAQDLLRGRGRRRFRSELTRRFELLLPEDNVSNVYITELVVN